MGSIKTQATDVVAVMDVRLKTACRVRKKTEAKSQKERSPQRRYREVRETDRTVGESGSQTKGEKFQGGYGYQLQK